MSNPSSVPSRTDRRRLFWMFLSWIRFLTEWYVRPRVVLIHEECRYAWNRRHFYASLCRRGWFHSNPCHWKRSSIDRNVDKHAWPAGSRFPTRPLLRLNHPCSCSTRIRIAQVHIRSKAMFRHEKWESIRDEQGILSESGKEALRCLLVCLSIGRRVPHRQHRPDLPSSDRVKPLKRRDTMELSVDFK